MHAWGCRQGSAPDLGEEVFISIVAAVNLRSFTLVSGPDIHASGFLDSPHVFDEITEDVRAALQNALNERVDDTRTLQQAMRRAIGRWVAKSFKARPMIVPVVIAV
jgi:ribonuclease J